MATVNFESKVISNGRITVPDNVRTVLQVKEGDHLRFNGTIEKVVQIIEEITVHSQKEAAQ